jgi:signal-transduction protein with cAMP-binding, CBS, and nucleotidyltransferase domain
MNRNFNHKVFERVELFSSLDEAMTAQILEAFVERTYADQTPIVSEGQAGTMFHIIKSGAAAVQLPAGGEIELHPSQYFGERSLLTGEMVRARSLRPAGSETHGHAKTGTL